LADKKRQVCLVCGQPSTKTICDACSDRLRAEALDNMANRTGVDELRSLVSVIAQAERFGTSVAKALRNQGESLRARRRLQAEEKAQKTAVKLMIPLVMLILPAMGIVLAGPAAINLMEAFGK
jgi:tight adherence protein C